MAIKYKYSQAATADDKNAAVDEMKSLLASSDGNTAVQLYASQLFLTHGLTKDALQCVHLGSTMEHTSMALQIYLKLDRIDLAKKQLNILKQLDEDAVLTSLGGAYIALAGGRSTASDAQHFMNSLSEQYGPSPLLLNLIACSYCTLGEYVEAETRLIECKKEFEQPNADTLINLIVCSQFLNKDATSYVTELKEGFPSHPYCEALSRVEGAFDREAIKYKVKA